MMRYVIISIILVVDCSIKYFIVSRINSLLDFIKFLEVIPNFLNVVFMKNDGIIFGIFSGYNSAFIVISIFLIVILFLCYKSVVYFSSGSNFSFILILFGICGNLIDRFLYGFVIDFIDVHVGNLLQLPFFNLSDCLIITGVIIFLVHIICKRFLIIS